MKALKPTLVFLCLVFLVASCASRQSTHKSDREMIQVFQSHQAEFERLLAMFRADKGLLYFSNAYVMQPSRSIVPDLDQGASKSAPYRLIHAHWYLALDDAD